MATAKSHFALFHVLVSSESSIWKTDTPNNFIRVLSVDFSDSIPMASNFVWLELERKDITKILQILQEINQIGLAFNSNKFAWIFFFLWLWWITGFKHLRLSLDIYTLYGVYILSAVDERISISGLFSICAALHCNWFTHCNRLLKSTKLFSFFISRCLVGQECT